MKIKKKSEEDLFGTFCSNENTKKKAKYLEIIKQAKRDAGGPNDFIRSCEKFLNDSGFLTPKQIEALENQFDPDDYVEEDEDYYRSMYMDIHYKD